MRSYGKVIEGLSPCPQVRNFTNQNERNIMQYNDTCTEFNQNIVD